MPNQGAYILPSLGHNGNCESFYHERGSELVGTIGHADVETGDIIIAVIGVGKFYLFEVINSTPDCILVTARLVEVRGDRVRSKPSLFQASLFPFLQRGLIIATVRIDVGTLFIRSLPRKKKKDRHIVSQLYILPRVAAKKILGGKEDAYEGG